MNMIKIFFVAFLALLGSCDARSIDVDFDIKQMRCKDIVGWSLYRSEQTIAHSSNNIKYYYEIRYQAIDYYKHIVVSSMDGNIWKLENITDSKNVRVIKRVNPNIGKYYSYAKKQEKMQFVEPSRISHPNCIELEIFDGDSSDVIVVSGIDKKRMPYEIKNLIHFGLGE